jgi:hypothetical protein
MAVTNNSAYVSTIQTVQSLYIGQAPGWKGLKRTNAIACLCVRATVHLSGLKFVQSALRIPKIGLVIFEA